MSSDDEDQLLAKRAKRAANVINLDSDDDSLPSWLADHKSPAAGALPSSSDSSDIEEVTAPTQAAKATQQAAMEDPTGPSQPAAQQTEGQPTQEEPPSQPQAGRQRKQDAAPQQRVRLKKDEEAPAAEPAGPDTSQPPASQPASQPATAQKRGAGGLHAPSSRMPLMLPDKQPQMKVLVELESVEGGATDLAGDAGAVGRVLVTGPPGDQHVQIDLKGVLYSATIVPCPVTMAVVNVGQSEAKVESLFTEFLQLREDTRFSCHDTGALDTLLADDQEDNYMAGEGAGGAGGEEGGGAKKGGGRKKAGGEGKAGAKGAKGGAKGAGKGLKKTAGGGVKKPRSGGAGGAKATAKAGAGKAKPKPKPKAGAAAKPKAGAAAKPKAGAAAKKK